MEAAASDFDAVYKIILVGDTGVGKSSILARPTTTTDAPPPPPPPPTVGVDFSFRTLEVDGKRVRLHLWDATGKPQYRMITTSYQRVAHVIIFCYDVTRPDTMCTRPPCAPARTRTRRPASSHAPTARRSGLRTWADEASKLAPSHVARLLVGCKADARADDSVSIDAARRFGAQMGIGVRSVLETSAVTGANQFVERKPARHRLTRSRPPQAPISPSSSRSPRGVRRNQSARPLSRATASPRRPSDNNNNSR